MSNTMGKEQSQRDDIAVQALERLRYVVYLVLNAVRMRRRSRAFGSFSRIEKSRMVQDIDKRLHEPTIKKRLHELVSTAQLDTRHGPERAIMLSEAASRIRARILSELYEDDFHVTAQSLLNDYTELREWFFESPVFEEWQNAGPWYMNCYGEPRCGKSAFAAAVARWLRNKHADDAKCAVVSLFLGHGQNKKRYTSYHAVLEAVLRQLVESKSDHDHHRDTLQELDGEQLKTLRQSPDLLRDHVVRQTESFSKVFIIVDGLDESATEGTLNLLKENLVALLKLCLASTYGLRLMLVQARTNTDGPTAFQNALCDALEESEVPCGKVCEDLYWRCARCSEAFYVCHLCFGLRRYCLDRSHILNVDVEIHSVVSNYIDAKLKSMMEQTRIGRLMSSAMSITAHVQNVINEKAAGAFVIAKLYIDSLLEQQSIEDVLDVLDRLPTYQRVYYSSLMSEIIAQPSPDKTLALTALALVAGIHNVGGIPLTFEELQAAIAVHTGLTDRTFTKAHLVECTKGFFEISDVVMPFHNSAGTFLAEECGETLQSFDTAKFCIWTIRNWHDGYLQMPAGPLHNQTVQRLRAQPFVAYCLRHWAAYLCLTTSPETTQAGLTFLYEEYERDTVIQEMMFLAVNTHMTNDFWTGGGPLHVAAWFGLVVAPGEVQQQNGFPDPNSREPNKGRTPLHLACSRGHSHAALALMRMGTDLSIQDQDGRTPLWNAVDNGDVPTLRALLQDPQTAEQREQLRRAINARNAHFGNQTVLMLALQRVYDDDGLNEIVALLLRQPYLDPGIQDSAGRTALHIAASSPFSTGLQMLIASTLIDLDFSLRDAAGRTPLIAAISSGQYLGNNKNHLSSLIDRASRHVTFDVNAVDNHGRSILHFAAMDEGYLPMVRQLRTAKASDSVVNMRDEHGRTPLHVAVVYLEAADDDGVVMSLKAAGVDLAASDEQGMTAYDLAVQQNRPWKDNIRPEGYATQQRACLIPWDYAFNNPEEFAGRLDNLPLEVLEQSDPTGCTLLHWAVYTEQMAAVESLLNQGQVNANAQDLGFQTALQIALEKGDLEIVQLLLDHGVDVNIAGARGRSPLECAFDIIDYDSRLRGAMVLIKSGARQVVAQETLQEILNYAIRCGDLETVEPLLAGGANLFLYCRDGLLPSEVAKDERASEQMIELLRIREQDVFGNIAVE